MPIYIIRSTCAVSRWPFPGVFAMCFIGIDGLFFALGNLGCDIVFTLLLQGCKVIHIFLDFQRESRIFQCGGGNFRIFTLILINTTDIFAVVNLIHGGLFLEISLIILFY